MSKMVSKALRFFVQKLKFCTLLIIRFGSNFTSMKSQYVLNNVLRDFRLAVLAFAMVARKNIKVKFTAKIDFPIGHLGHHNLR